MRPPPKSREEERWGLLEDGEDMTAVHYAVMVRVNDFLSELMVLRPQYRPCYFLVLADIAVLIMPALACFAMSRHGDDNFKVHRVIRAGLRLA